MIVEIFILLYNDFFSDYCFGLGYALIDLLINDFPS